MGFFSDNFHVKADKERNLLRVSVRLSEESVFEYWLLPQSVKPFIVAPNYDEWTGTEEFQAKVTGSGATVAIKTSEGVTYLKCSTSHLWLFRAHMEAAYSELEAEEGSSTQGLSGTATLEIFHRIQKAHQREMIEKVDAMLTDRLNLFADSLLMAIDKKIAAIPTFQARPTSHDERRTDTSEPVFIPSDLVSDDLSGTIQTTTTNQTNDIQDAVAALRKLKKERT